MKKIFCLLFVFIMLSAFIMAGGGQQGGASGVTEIRASYWGDTRRFDLYDQILQEFERAHPNVRVIREPTSWNDYWDRLAVQVAGGNATDFLSMHPQFSSDYIPRGVMEPLDPFISDGTISLDGWSQGVIDTGRHNNQIYMLAMGVTFSGVIINTGLFRELGVTPPGFEWSWDEARSIGLQVRQALDARGRRNAFMLAGQITSLNNFRYFARQQFNREVYDLQGNIAVTAQDVEAWFSMWKEFQDLGIVADAATGAEFTGATLENGMFAMDRNLALYVPVNQFWLYNTTFPNKEMDMVRHPGSRGSPHVGEFPEGAHYGVFARSTPDRKRAAAQLINFWLNDERSLALYRLDQGVPANTPVLQRAVLPTLDEYNLAAVDFVNRLSRIATPTIFPPPGASEIDALFTLMAERVQFEVATPAQAARDFISEATTIRARAAR